MSCHLIALALWFGYHPPVSGPGIPDGTRIVQVDCKAGLMTLSAAATAVYSGPHK